MAGAAAPKHKQAGALGFRLQAWQGCESGVRIDAKGVAQPVPAHTPGRRGATSLRRWSAVILAAGFGGLATPGNGA